MWLLPSFPNFGSFVRDPQYADGATGSTSGGGAAGSPCEEDGADANADRDFSRYLTNLVCV